MIDQQKIDNVAQAIRDAINTQVTDLTIPTQTSDLINDNNFISEEWGTFTELKALIDNASDGDTIVLDKNYRNTDNLNNTITIDKKIHIDGKNHIIDYNNLSNDNTYIHITYLAENTSISNCTFVNRTTNSEALLTINAPCSVINCIFRDNISFSPPITSISRNVIIKNCIFYNNKYYIMMTSNSINNYITNSLFFKNNGCLRISKNEKSTPITVNNCMFIDNNTTNGSIYLDNTNKTNIFNCVFYNNTSSGSNTGGAITTKVSSSASPNLVNNKFLTSNDTIYPTTLTNKEYAVGQIPTKTSDLTNDSGFLTQHQSLANYLQKSNTNGLVKNDGTIDTTQYLTEHQDISGKVNVSDIKDNLTSTDTDKPLSANQGKVLKGLIDGKADANRIPTDVSDLTDDTDLIYGQLEMKHDSEGRFLENIAFTADYNNLYNIPSIPTNTNQLTNGAGFITASAISGKEDISNKVTTISSSSTNTQYPSAKAVYDELPKTTKTLTVTYTNGTTEDIEFYIK